MVCTYFTDFYDRNARRCTSGLKPFVGDFTTLYKATFDLSNPPWCGCSLFIVDLLADTNHNARKCRVFGAKNVNIDLPAGSLAVCPRYSVNSRYGTNAICLLFYGAGGNCLHTPFPAATQQEGCTYCHA